MVGQGLKGVEALTLDYKVGWPLSIVLSRLLLSASFASYLKGIIICLLRRAITKYQLLSRLLYFSKHVERRVLASWFAFIALFAFNLTTFLVCCRMDHQYTKHLSMNIRVVMGPCYCLRHRMLHFLQNFVYYMTLEARHFYIGIQLLVES